MVLLVAIVTFYLAETREVLGYSNPVSFHRCISTKDVLTGCLKTVRADPYPPGGHSRFPAIITKEVANGRSSYFPRPRTIVGKGHQQRGVPGLNFLPAAGAGCFADEKTRLGDAPPGGQAMAAGRSSFLGFLDMAL